MARSEDRTQGGPEPADRDQFVGMPRWVKALGLVVLVLVLIMLGVHLAGGGRPSHSGSPAVATGVVTGAPFGAVSR